MCKTLITTRSFLVDSALGNWDTDIAPVPRYIKKWANPAYVYTGGIECDADPFLEPVITELNEIIPKLKTSQFGIFQNSLFSDSAEQFKYKFQVFLKQNSILSETITNTSSIINNNPDDFSGLYLYQPIITSTNTNGLRIYRDITDVVYNPDAANRPKKFSSIGITYDGSNLRVMMISGNYGDKTVVPSACDYDLQSIISDLVPISGVVDIELICIGKIYTIKVNNVIIPNLISGNPIFYNQKTVLGKFSDSIVETNYLYSDLCSIYYEINNSPVYQTSFEDAINNISSIIIPDTIGINTLTLYNYNILDILEDSSCCPVIESSDLNNFKNGCCFTPTKEDNIRYKTSTWFNNNFGLPYIADIEMMSKIGKSEESERLLKLVNQLNSFVMYLKFIRNKMICEEKAYYFFISDENITKFTEYFFIRGIDIKCLLEIMEIGNFKNCCGEVTPSVECTCKDEIPSAIISAIPYQFNLNSEANQTVTYTEVLDYQTRVNFSCCNGNQSIVISSVLINPNNLPIEITPGPVTINGTFSYDITYNYLNAVITDSKEFYVQFTICGKTILRKHLYSAIDTCVTIPTNNVPFENELAAITLDIDNGDFGITRETFLTTINLGNFECCHSGQRSKIISIDSSRITSESGLTILSPEPGDESQGTIPFSYYFDGENAIAGTVQNVFITYSICDDLVYTGYIKFTIVNTCTPDLTPTFDPVTNTNLDLDLDTMGSGDYNIEIGVSAYQCCGQSNVLYLRFLPNTYQAYTELALYGITFNFPTTVVQATNQINIPFKFNRDVYLAYKTNNTLIFPRTINFDFFYIACGPVPSLNNIINQYVIGFRLDDNCTPIFSGASSTTPIYHDLYLSRGNTVPVSTEVEFYCNSCDNNSGKFSYTGFRALSNDSKLINTIPIPQLLASGVSIPFNAKPHQINLGPYTSAFPLPDFPVQKSTTIEMKTSCWDNVTPALPAVNTTYQLAINSFIADNYFRSDGGPGGLSVTNKTSTFSWNPNIDESLTIIALIAPDAVPLNLLLDQLGYTTLSAGAGSLEVEVYPLNSNTCNSFGSLIQNTGDVSILTNANITGTGMNNSLSYDLSALSGSGVLSSGATLPLGYGFYFIKFYLKDKTADSFSVRFNIT